MLFYSFWGSRWVVAVPTVSVQCVARLREVFVACRTYNVRAVVLQLNRRDLDLLDALRPDIPLRGCRGPQEDVVEVGDVRNEFH